MADNLPTADGGGVHQGCTEAYQKLRRKSHEWERYARKLKAQKAEVEKSLQRQVDELQEQVQELQDQVKWLKAKEAEIREADQVRAEDTVGITNANTTQPFENESANRSDSTPPHETSAPRSRTLNPRFGKLNVATTQRALLLSGKLLRFDDSSGGWGRVAEQSEASDTKSSKAESADTDTDLWRVRSLHFTSCANCTDRTGTS